MTQAIVAGALAVTLGVVVWLYVRRRQPSHWLSKAEQARSRGQWAQAEQSLLKAIALLGHGNAGSVDEGTARLSLAEVLLEQQRPADALDHVRRALALGATPGYTLTRLLAEDALERGAADAEAVQFYIAAIAGRRGRRSRRASGGAARPQSSLSAELRGRLLAALETSCVIDEQLPAPDRQTRLDWNRLVAAASPDTEWAHYHIGLAALVAGDIDAAGVSLNRACALNPDRPLTYYWLSVCRLQQRVPDVEAAALLVDVLLEFPSNDAALARRQAAAAYRVGRALAETTGDAPTDHGGRRSPTSAAGRSLRLLSVAASLQPDRAEYQFAMGHAALETGDTRRGLVALERAVDLAPFDREYAFQLGTARYRFGDVAGAERALAQAIDLDPNHVPTHRLLATISTQRGRWDAAEASSRLVLRLAPPDAETYGNLLRALHGQALLQDVIDEAATVERLGFMSSVSADARYAVARSLSTTGSFESALRWYATILPDPRVLYYRGCAFANLGSFHSALECFDRVLESESDLHFTAHLQRGHVLRALERFDEADASYDRALTLSPGDATLRCALGTRSFERGDFATAQQHFVDSLALDPANAQARLGLAIVAERSGDIAGAGERYATLLTDEAVAPVARIRLGILSYRAGDPAKAIDLFEPVSERKDDVLLFYQGASSAAVGQLDAALSCWTTLIERHPHDAALQRNISRLQYLRGVQLAKSERWVEAIDAWRGYSATGSSDIRTQLGAMHAQLARASLAATPSDIPSAARHLADAIDCDRDNTIYQYYAALCDLHTDNAAGALRQLEIITEMWGASPRLSYHRGLCLLRLGRTDDAIATLETLVDRHDTGHFGRWAGWAIANERVRQGRPIDAAAMLDHAVPVPEAVR